MKTVNFATLEGTEKQVKWAQEIRIAAEKNILKEIEMEIEFDGISIEESEQLKQLLYSKLEVETSAKWWIDNRDCYIKAIINK